MSVSRLRHFGRRHVRRVRQSLGNLRGCRRASFDERQVIQQFARRHDERRHSRQPMQRLAVTSECAPADDVIARICGRRFVLRSNILTLAAARTFRNCRHSRDKFRCAAGLVGVALGHAAIDLRFRPIARAVQPSQVDSRSSGLRDGEARWPHAMSPRPGHALRQRVATA